MLLRCYAEGKDNRWEAVCLDFDIAVQGGSFNEVYESLNKGIRMYLEYVEQLPESERRAFHNRRAPISLRFRFLWHALCGLFDGGADSGKLRHEYTTTCLA